MITETIKSDFPFFASHPDLVYLDTGTTALKPEPVIEAISDYYKNYPVSVHRGFYDLSTFATQEYEAARKKVAKFINSENDEIIFTSGTTHGLNLLAGILARDLSKNDTVALTRMEHHANLIPWQQAAKQTGAKIRFIEIDKNFNLDMASARQVIDETTKIVSFTHTSNVLGTITPINELVALARAVNAVTVVDAAQGIVHEKIDVKKLDIDWLVFSGHKLYGPTGVGVLYGKRRNLENHEPFFFGGDMVKKVSYEDAEWAESPYKFEAGTPPIAQVIGVGAAIDFLTNLGWESIKNHEHELTNYALSKMRDEANIIGPKDNSRSSLISFLIYDVHPHDIGDILNTQGIALRVGHHCAMPLMQKLGLVGTARVSFGVYNTKEDIDRLMLAIAHVKKIFRV